MDKINIRRSESNARRDAANGSGIVLRIKRRHPGHEDSYYVTGLVGIDELEIIDVLGQGYGFRLIWGSEVADLVNPEVGPVAPAAGRSEGDPEPTKVGEPV